MIGLPIRLLVALGLAGILLVLAMHSGFMVAGVLRNLLLLVLLAGYTWAVYFGFPFFRQRARHLRIFLSTGLALMLLCLTGFVVALVMNAALSGKSDQRVESVTLPSGEILENHTYCETGWLGGVRINELFLKNPATGASERVDAHGNLDYGYGHSLLERYPHPREIVRGDEKVLLIGPYVCKRRTWKTGPEWYTARFDTAAGDAAKYLRSFFKPANPALYSSSGAGPECFLHYQIDSLDLENNVLTVKRVPWNAQVESPEFRDFPDYLVYRAIGYNGRSGYQFPWKFDEARARAKNGPRWEKPMPFKMALDYSVITFPAKAGFMPHEKKRDVALAHAGAREIAATSLELSDQELRGAECKYAVLTNAIIDKIVAIYGYACSQTNRFCIVWEPRDPEAWQSAGMLNLDEWTLVGEGAFVENVFRDEYIRLRKIEP